MREWFVDVAAPAPAPAPLGAGGPNVRAAASAAAAWAPPPPVDVCRRASFILVLLARHWAGLSGDADGGAFHMAVFLPALRAWWVPALAGPAVPLRDVAHALLAVRRLLPSGETHSGAAALAPLTNRMSSAGDWEHAELTPGLVDALARLGFGVSAARVAASSGPARLAGDEENDGPAATFMQLGGGRAPARSTAGNDNRPAVADDVAELL